MKVSINPEHKGEFCDILRANFVNLLNIFLVPEMTFENNAATCKLLYTQQYARVYDCKVGRPYF